MITQAQVAKSGATKRPLRRRGWQQMGGKELPREAEWPTIPKPLVINALGHRFRQYGNEEMICVGCDFIIWPVRDAAAAVRAVLSLNGKWCPASLNTAGEN